MKYKILKEVDGEFIPTGEVLDTGERLHSKANEKAQARVDELQAKGGCYAAQVIHDKLKKSSKKK